MLTYVIPLIKFLASSDKRVKTLESVIRLKLIGTMIGIHEIDIGIPGFDPVSREIPPDMTMFPKRFDISSDEEMFVDW